MLKRRERLTAQLPPTPCTPEMRRQVEELASKGEMSIAEFQRQVMSLFLAENYSIAVVNPSETIDTAPSMILPGFEEI